MTEPRSGASWRLDSLGPALLVVSCLYVGLPYLIFLAGWVKWWLALPAAAMVVIPCWGVLRSARRQFATPESGDTAPSVRWHQLLLLVGVAVVLSVLSGMGGYGVQEGDYFKHNAVLKSLIERPWPVTVSSDAGGFPLVYYTAWYLPAAALGKIAGWNAANHFMFFWGTMGLILSMLWFCLLVRRLNWLTIGMFVAFSGLDVVGAAILMLSGLAMGSNADLPLFHGILPDWGALRWWNWEIRWWAGPCSWSYSSNVALLFWVPQQALGGWIVTGMVLHAFRRNDDRARRSVLFYTALSALWTPFVTIGLLPLLVADVLLDKRPVARRMRAWLTGPNLCGAALLGLTALYFAARLAPLPFSNDPAARLRFFGNESWTGLEFLWRFVLFVALEVGILAGLAWMIRPPDGRRCRGLLWIVLSFLCVLPLFRYGMNNDLVLRASIPCLMVLAVFLTGALLAKQPGRVRRFVFVAVLAVAATNPLCEVYRHVREIERRGALLIIPNPRDVRSLWEENCLIRDRSDGNDHFFRQYIGSPDAFFFKYLARPVAGTRRVPSAGGKE